MVQLPASSQLATGRHDIGRPERRRFSLKTCMEMSIRCTNGAQMLLRPIENVPVKSLAHLEILPNPISFLANLEHFINSSENMPLLWYFTAMFARSVLAAASEKPSMAVKRGIAICRSCNWKLGWDAPYSHIIQIKYKHTIDRKVHWFLNTIYDIMYISFSLSLSLSLSLFLPCDFYKDCNYNNM